MQPFFPLLALVRLVDAKDIRCDFHFVAMSEKVRALDLPLEIGKITSKLKTWNYNSETYDSSPENMGTRRNDLSNKSKSQARIFCSYDQKLTTPFATVFENK